MNGGGAAPFEELVSIAALCRERNVRLHLDGARLWEVAPHFGKSYAEICAVFDTAYVSFYKGAYTARSPARCHLPRPRTALPRVARVHLQALAHLAGL
eukprot:2803621-Prymnesium_polylepis.2